MDEPAEYPENTGEAIVRLVGIRNEPSLPTIVPPCGICAEPLLPEADLIGPPHDRGWPTLNRQPVHLECRRLYVMGGIPATPREVD